MNSTRDPLSGAPLSTLIGVLEWMRYTSATGPVILIYDYFITLDDEVCLISLSLAYSARLTVVPCRSVSFGRGPLACQRHCITLIAIYPWWSSFFQTTVSRILSLVFDLIDLMQHLKRCPEISGLHPPLSNLVSFSHPSFDLFKWY